MALKTRGQYANCHWTHSQHISQIDRVIYCCDRVYPSMVVGGIDLPMAKVALQTLIVGIGCGGILLLSFVSKPMPSQNV